QLGNLRTTTLRQQHLINFLANSPARTFVLASVDASSEGGLLEKLGGDLGFGKIWRILLKEHAGILISMFNNRKKILGSDNLMNYKPIDFAAASTVFLVQNFRLSNKLIINRLEHKILNKLAYVHKYKRAMFQEKEKQSTFFLLILLLTLLALLPPLFGTSITLYTHLVGVYELTTTMMQVGQQICLPSLTIDNCFYKLGQHCMIVILMNINLSHMLRI
ncbi:hypothetical protein ACJX0J_030531, partial [Zea mays]